MIKFIYFTQAYLKAVGENVGSGLSQQNVLEALSENSSSGAFNSPLLQKIHATTYKLLEELNKLSPTTVKVIGQGAALNRKLFMPVGKFAQGIDQLPSATAAGIEDGFTQNYNDSL